MDRFALPGGDKLVALWIDGIALENAQATEVTLVIPGLSGHRAIAMDILRGYQQQLISHDEGVSLMLSRLLIEDYPILLRLTD